nr:hypothetical protein [Tanacetum cinerariifolium]
MVSFSLYPIHKLIEYEIRAYNIVRGMSVITTGKSSSRGIIIKKKKQSTPSIPPSRDDKERDEMEEIDKLVDGNKDEESYVSSFANSVVNNDDYDTGSKLKPGSHKEHPEHMSDDDEMKRKDEEVDKEK